MNIDHRGNLNQYALGFSIAESDYGYNLRVENPWENARNVQIEYHLLMQNIAVPDSLRKKNIIRIPVTRVICLSTSHLAFLDMLDALVSVRGISGSHYISNPFINDGIAKGVISDVGYGSNLNYEEIIRLKPDLILVYGVDSEVSGYLEKFRELGIPAVIMAEYLEESPLGKAEWIRFAASFFGKEKLADSLFLQMEKSYNQLAGLVSDLPDKPGVMVGLPYRDAWWIPGGRSYMARLITDAGGKYLGGKNHSRESFVVSMEEAIRLFSDAEVWLNTGMVAQKSEILRMDSRFEKLPFYRLARIYNNNKRSTSAGGMDFWESGTVQPDKILADMIRIFHPGFLPGDSLTYYREIR